MDMRPISAVHVMCISSESSFMELRTRQAPVPQERIIMPTRPMTDALADRLAPVIGVGSDGAVY